MEARRAAAVEKADAEAAPLGSLGRRRQAEAQRFMRRFLLEVADSPSIRGGVELTDADLARITDEHLKVSGIPAHIQPGVKPVARAILAQMLAGEKQEARTYAAEQAMGFADDLVKSAAWHGEPEDDFDPREVAARVPRS